MSDQRKFGVKHCCCTPVCAIQEPAGIWNSLNKDQHAKLVMGINECVLMYQEAKPKYHGQEITQIWLRSGGDSREWVFVEDLLTRATTDGSDHSDTCLKEIREKLQQVKAQMESQTETYKVPNSLSGFCKPESKNCSRSIQMIPFKRPYQQNPLIKPT